MEITDFFSGNSGLSALFSSHSAGAGKDDEGNIITNHQTLSALTGTIAAAYADGDDNFVWASVKGVFDFAAMNDFADGDGGFLSKVWLAHRGGSIASHQTGGGMLTYLGSAVASYYGLGKWEDFNAGQKAAAAPKPA